jgi:hypothetical protein
LDREKIRVDDFGQFDTFSACIMINGRHDKRGGSSQNKSISNESIVYKGKKEHLGRSFATDLGLGISRNLFIESLSVKTHRGWKMTYMDG